MLERDVERHLVNGVKAQGDKAYKWVSPGNVGVPDRIVVWPGGKVEFIELKTDNGRLSKLQSVQICRLLKLGCYTRVLYGLKGVVDYLMEDHSGGDDAA